ncbi:hypothetical protein B7R21_10415 [Subtercola boreus]|uniref:D-serine dehydratase-like domain-containing protein n=1 Tax=Subtercola boreus TaxID=120213 RepID=A0A3E0VRU6_9MICO|nr:alanine racemase [Subtercola boreus]RFA12734.1 hypothetical protein B7R21_10415 [Subtercola boreus]
MPRAPGDTLMTVDDLPRMVLHEAAIEHNLALMSAFCEQAGMLLAPHAKTHLSKDLCDRQLAAGAWGLTAATTSQVRTLVAFGSPRILHANVLVDARAIEFVASTFLAADSATEYLCYVDSLAGLDLLEHALEMLSPAKKLRVLVELGYQGGRTGARSESDARHIGHRVAASTRLELAGVAGYEGLMPRGENVFPDAAPALLAGIRRLATYFHGEGLFAGTPVVTAGGSSYFDLVAAELGPQNFDFEILPVLRSGCYLTHDHGVYARTSPLGDSPREVARPAGTAGSPETDAAAVTPVAAFEPAFELLASVLSAPEPGLVIVGFGRREAPTDDTLPVVLGVADPEGGVPLNTAGWTVTAVNDHHAYLRVPAESTVPMGTVLRFGISHPCGAFDRWRSIPLVDAHYGMLGEITPEL